MRHYYAVEYAYGSGVVNNGGRADKHYKFGHKGDRDEFVFHGSSFNGPGMRQALSASQVRSVKVFENDRLGAGNEG